jgi:hypothetical protein
MPQPDKPRRLTETQGVAELVKRSARFASLTILLITPLVAFSTYLTATGRSPVDLLPTLSSPAVGAITAAVISFLALLTTVLAAANGARSIRPRPRLVLTHTDDGRSVHPTNSRIWAQNRGETDAFDVSFDVIQEGKTILEPLKIAYLKAQGEPVEVRTAWKFLERPEAEQFDQPLARGIEYAIGIRLDNMSMPAINEVTKPGGVRDLKLVVRYRDHDGTRYSNTFLVQYSWVLRKFEPIELQFE